jgi:hypothetical protein
VPSTALRQANELEPSQVNGILGYTQYRPPRSGPTSIFVEISVSRLGAEERQYGEHATMLVR